MRLAFAVGLACGLGLAVPSARAQGDDGTRRVAAAEAYDRGAAHYLAEDYARAAEWFETAYRLAPTAEAMIQAIRAHERAGNAVRAGTLALRLPILHGDQASATRLAERVLSRVSPSLFRIDVECDDCTVELDGRIVPPPVRSVLVEPGEPHRVVAYFGERGVEQRVQGEPGERRLLEVERPAPGEIGPIREVPDDGAETASGGTVRPSSGEAVDDEGGWSPAVFWVSAGLTAVVTGTAVWSGLDTLAGVDDFESMPSDEAFQEGESKERRTNVLIGAAAGMAAVTLIVGVFLTNWNGDEDVRMGVTVGADHALLSLGVSH